MSLLLSKKELLLRDFFDELGRTLVHCRKCNKDYTNHVNDMKKHLNSGNHDHLDFD